jgi:hypothetical protein
MATGATNARQIPIVGRSSTLRRPRVSADDSADASFCGNGLFIFVPSVNEYLYLMQ